MYITTLFGGNRGEAADNSAVKAGKEEKVLEIPAWVWEYEKTKERRNVIVAAAMIAGVGRH